MGESQQNEGQTPWVTNPTAGPSSPSAESTESDCSHTTPTVHAEHTKDAGVIRRPTTMTLTSSQRPPPLGPFPSAYDNNVNNEQRVPPSPISLPPYTPYGQPFSAAPLAAGAITFDYSHMQYMQQSPISPMTPLSPVDRHRHLSRSSSSQSSKSAYDPYNGRYVHPAASIFGTSFSQAQILAQIQELQSQRDVHSRMMAAMQNSSDQSAPSIKHTWYRTFDELFSTFRDPWMLRQIDSADQEPTDPGWASEEFWAKVRFICETEACPNQWTSMRGVIRFWYTTALRPYYTSDQQVIMIRQLLFRSYGQKCAKCGNPTFQTPLWYEREVKKVLTKMYENIARAVYQVYLGHPLQRNMHRAAIESQKGAPTAEHKSELCQGCANNTCSLSVSFRSRPFNEQSSRASPAIRPMNVIPETADDTLHSNGGDKADAASIDENATQLSHTVRTRLNLGG